MDTWQDEQVRRMQLGGNLPFKEFMKSYEPADQGGFKEGASPYDTYHCWAAAQYREKLDAMLAGRDWSPSAPPATFTAGSRSASPAPSSQGLRKSRASNRTLTGRSGSNSPAPSFRSSPGGTPNLNSNPANDQKTANENYFAGLGRANENRPVDLPPSQGGRYTGFGSTPTPPPNSNPLSSANAPTLSDLQENPVAAISKGWSLFAAAVAGASRVVTENVIQPGVEKVTDPNFQANVKGYMTEAQKKAVYVGSSANEWSKHQFGVDVADTVGGVVGTVKERVVGGPSRSGYGSLSLTSPNDAHETSALYHDDDDDLFTEYHGNSPQTTSFTAAAASTGSTAAAAKAPAAKANDWDDWKDF
ncbi:hypothetical protein BDN70DRAFT_875809 [Pholiota conissans]|uniref:ADP-ribosylation factor GTPase-activating protein GCS1 n=1 Tax=Pholiota conissans TaxID=109636 RepID=A0A9P5Z6R6_9AGAR|nr:hypothetical protein BDN70DRAFT_875809 [Pholiota conissans]